MGANGRNGPVTSVSSEIHCFRCPVVSDSSDGVELVCGMNRGISEHKPIVESMPDQNT